jgi:hypothetical protein
MLMSQQVTFDPSKYLTKVGSSDYLEVKWRLVWLRETNPDASIDTELVSHDGQMAVFRAKVAIPGGGSATGWGSEAVDDFRDYLEKAETKALGRALAALGFGTQFCPDFDFGAAAGKVVDTPIDFASTRGRRIAAANAGADQRVAQVGQAATPRQLKFMEAVAREAGLSEDDLKEEVQRTYGRAAHELSRRDASAFIEKLQNRRASLDMAS